MKSLAMTAHQFAICRLALGAYLLVHFLCITPDVVELFSEQGMIPDLKTLPTWTALPNLFWFSDSPAMAYAVVGAGITLSVFLSIGERRRLTAFLLWVIWFSLFNRNPLISNPSIPFIGFLLLIMTALPAGEPFSKDRQILDWSVPKWLPTAVLFVLMGGYTVSGLHKLSSPSWLEGTALRHVLELPLARDMWLTNVVLELPDSVLRFGTWSALSLEVLALPLTCLTVCRRWIWFALVLMNVGILCLIDFADLTFGILIVHLFAFDRRWIPPRKWQSERPVVFFDGVCNLCNHTVDFVIAEDVAGRFDFAPVQGETVKSIDAEEVRSGESMALRDGDVLYTKSDAVLHIAAGLGGLWRILSWARLIPRALRDAVYFQVQKSRYSVFGKRDTCRLPTPEEQERFLP